MRGLQQDTPPSSVNGDDDITGIDGGDEEFIYIGDADEVLGEGDGEGEDSSSDLGDIEEEEREPPREDAVLVFSKHTGSVFCCDIHPNGKIAVTGGEDDKAYIWSMESGETLVECAGHKDSVIFAGFSFDGAYLATADMSGVIVVRKCTLDTTESPWPVVWEYEAGDVIWGLWHYGTRVLIFGAAAGEMYVFRIPSGETKVLQGHSSKLECGKMLPDGRRIAVGHEDGSVKIWDLKSESVVHHIQAETALEGVTAIDTHPDNNLVICISAEGKALLMTAATGKIVGHLEVGVDVEAVAFARDPELPYFAVGGLDGSVSIWDVSRQMLRHQCSAAGDDDAPGVTKLFWHKHYLFTACLDGSIRVYDGRSGTRTHQLTGHMSEVLDISFHAQENTILTGSDDDTARVFKFQEIKD